MRQGHCSGEAGLQAEVGAARPGGEGAQAAFPWRLRACTFPWGWQPSWSVVHAGTPPFTSSREPSVPPGRPIKASIVCVEEKTHFRKPSVLCLVWEAKCVSAAHASQLGVQRTGSRADCPSPPPGWVTSLGSSRKAHGLYLGTVGETQEPRVLQWERH